MKCHEIKNVGVTSYLLFLYNFLEYLNFFNLFSINRWVGKSHPKISWFVILLSLADEAPALLIGSYICQGITRTPPATLALLQNSVCHQFPNIP